MINPFFDKTLHFTSPPDYRDHGLRMSNLEVGAIGMQLSFFLVDQYKRTIKLCSYNPDLADIFGTTGVKPLGKEFIDGLLHTNNDDKFSTRVIETVNEILKGDVLGNNNRTYCLSFNLPIIYANDTVRMLRFKVTPHKFTNTSEDEIPWLVYYDIRRANTNQLGCFKILDINNAEEHFVYINEDSTCTTKYELLSKNDIEIIQLSSDGLTEPEIAEQIGTNMGHMKYMKTSLLLRLNVKSISHAIAKVKKQGFI